MKNERRWFPQEYPPLILNKFISYEEIAGQLQLQQFKLEGPFSRFNVLNNKLMVFLDQAFMLSMVNSDNSFMDLKDLFKLAQILEENRGKNFSNSILFLQNDELVDIYQQIFLYIQKNYKNIEKNIEENDEEDELLDF